MFAVLAGAQQTPPAAQEPSNRISVDVERVNLLFAVTDKKGRFITDLAKEDLAVFEHKKEQQIMEFTAESDLPLRLAILIDTSNSVRDRFKFQQEAALEFIRNVLRPKQDKATIIGFDTATELIADLTSDIDKLEKGIKSLRPGGGTSLFDAVFFASRDKLMQDAPNAQIPPRHGDCRRW